MENQDFSKIGQEIRDAVNQALERQDFSGLNEAISHTVDGAVKEVRNRVEDAVKGAQNRAGDAVGGILKGAQSRMNQAMDQAVRFTASDHWKSADRERQSGRERQSAKESRSRETMGGWRAGGNELLYGKAPVKATAVLSIVFGSMLMAGFGIPMLVSFAIGAGFAEFGIFQRLGLFFFMPLTIASGALLGCGIRSIQRRSRFRSYVRSIGTKTICAIKTLSRTVGKSESFVCRDLNRMIRDGLFLQGHIDDEQTCLMVTDETYEMYLQSRERVKAARGARSREPLNQEPVKQESGEGKQESAADQKMKEILDNGLQYMETIRQVNEELPDPVISEKLDKLEKVIGLIFVRLQKCPEQLASMKRFTDYYLPTTIKLVKAYREFEQSEVETERVNASKAEIEQTLDTINLAFEQMLDSLYEEDTMDISSDIQVLQTLLAQEGYVEDGLHSMDDIFEGVSGVRRM